MRLQQIGENLIKIRDLDPEAFQLEPDSWHKLAGLRNVISHSYESIEPDTIWIIVRKHLQPFRAPSRRHSQRFQKADYLARTGLAITHRSVIVFAPYSSRRFHWSISCAGGVS